MKISEQKTEHKKYKMPQWLEKTLSYFSGKRGVILGLVIFLLYSAVIVSGSFLSGIAARNKIHKTLFEYGLSGGSLSMKTAFKNLADSVIRIPGRYIDALYYSEAPEVLEMHVKFKHMHTLHEKRNEALEQGQLIQGEDDYVPGQIFYKDQKVKVKLRLKGDWVDHLKGDKWSFRVKTSGGKQIMGMRVFSIQAPATRGYQQELLFQEQVKMEGILSPRYKFVHVKLNGKDLGIMAIEEHFSKEMLESQGRKESAIIRFDESLFWDSIALNHQNYGVYNNYAAATISPFQSGKLEKNPVLSRDRDIAIGLLRGFIDGNIKASEAFDPVNLGKYLAITEVWGVGHSLGWGNVRYYYNPLKGKLEVIGYDADAQFPDSSQRLMVPALSKLTESMLADPKVRKVYVESVKRLSEGYINGTLVEELKRYEGPHLKILHREYPILPSYDFSRIQARAKTLLGLTMDNYKTYSLYSSPEHGFIFPKLANAYMVKKDGKTVLELVNLVDFPLEVSGVRFNPKDGSTNKLILKHLDGSPVTLPLSLPATNYDSPPTPTYLVYEFPENKNAADLTKPAAESPQPLEGKVEVTARIKKDKQTTSEPQIIKAEPYVLPATKPVIERWTAQKLQQKYPFFKFNSESNTFTVNGGSYQIREMVVFPEGANLLLNAGTTLRFNSDAGLILNGAFNIKGTAHHPVTLTAVNPQARWEGVAVIGSEQASSWKYARVSYTNGVDLPDWALTGAVSFYNAGNVKLEQSSFVDNQAEDALNIVHCNFVLKHVTIEKTRSDAFDSDFSTGKVLAGKYIDIGGDGVDVSGTKIAIKDVYFSGVRDKAVSIGEASHAVASGLIINSSGTAVASKDNSSIQVSDSTINNIEHVGIMAYVKKPEYGPARVVAKNINFMNTYPEAIAQTGSSIVLEERDIPSEDIDIEKLYKEGYMKK